MTLQPMSEQARHDLALLLDCYGVDGVVLGLMRLVEPIAKAQPDHQFYVEDMRRLLHWWCSGEHDPRAPNGDADDLFSIYRDGPPHDAATATGMYDHD